MLKFPLPYEEKKGFLVGCEDFVFLDNLESFSLAFLFLVSILVWIFVGGGVFGGF